MHLPSTSWIITLSGASIGITWLVYLARKPFRDVTLSHFNVNGSVPTRLVRQSKPVSNIQPEQPLLSFIASMKVSQQCLEVARDKELTMGAVLDCLEPDQFGFSPLDKLSWLGIPSEDTRVLLNALTEEVVQAPDPVAQSTHQIDVSVLQNAISTVSSHFQDSGVIATSNNFGVMLTQPTWTMQQWLQTPSHDDLPKLEVGSAYGVATLPALLSGQNVIANDLSGEHLNTLNTTFQHIRTSQRHSTCGKLSFLEGNFLFASKALQSNSISNILASNVLHFASPAELCQTFAAFYRVLAPGGRIFIEVDSPYISGLGLLYHLYAIRRRFGSLFPGYIYFGGILNFLLPSRLSAITNYQVFHTDLLIREAESAGFRVEVAKYDAINPQTDAFNLAKDGREIAILVAIKD